ncbi:hypothetical protein UA08_06411 [Talaromyces atroroseus]|uniref:Xylanolytic transcriptional activator regulatory domain-containing protein n=1 Tax=Talaromyces atroroseus TaxID=1441469 RepID=A0A225ALP2_TALAT|nr:hypothetical protein UA08_06411 [Talaromyces atroroseus]OKL58168.1 hypothetical protein UA08_06411 [Talaromyces atroroseus]
MAWPACILKCDAKQKFPSPCTRCEKFNKSCAIDPSFRRTARRQRLHMLENELRQLKETIAEPRALPGEGISTLDESSNSPQGREQSIQYEEPPTTEEIIPDLQSTGIFCDPQTLEEVTIPPTVICDLFQEYMTWFKEGYPREANALKTQILPLLSSQISAAVRPENDSSRLRIMPLAFLGHHGHCPIRRLAGTEIASTMPPSLSLIHALLLLCCWPLPFEGMNTDPSWVYCGSATHMALQMGIHRPDRLREFRPHHQQTKEDVVMCSKTWFSCFIINQSLSCQLGIPSTVKLDHSILRAVQEKRTACPRSITDLLQIAYKSFSFSELLGHYGGTPDGLLPDAIPMIESIENDLNTLEAANWDSWCLTAKTCFLNQKLFLYSYSLTTPHSSSHSLSTLPPGYKTTYFLSQIYTTAIRLINTWCSSVSVSPSDSSTSTPSESIGRSWTIFERNALIYAVMLLLHLAELSTNANDDLREDSVTRNNAIRSVLTYVKPHSVRDNDIFARICEIIEITCSLENQPGGNMPRDSPSPAQSKPFPEVRSRMSSNLSYTVARRARMRRENKRSGDIAKNQEVDGTLDYNSDDNYGSFGQMLLPPAPFLDYSLSSLWSSLDFDAADLFGGEFPRPNATI